MEQNVRLSTGTRVFLQNQSCVLYKMWFPINDMDKIGNEQGTLCMKNV